MIVSGNQDPSQIDAEFEQLKRALPFEDVANLLTHHQTHRLIEFCHHYSALFESNRIFARLAHDIQANDAFFDFLGQQKRIYALDQYRYIFIDREDRQRVKEMPVDQRNALLLSFNNFFEILPQQGGKKRASTTLIKREKADKISRLDDIVKWKDLSVALAVKDRELEYAQALHQKEKEILLLQLQNKEMEIYHLRCSNNNNNIPSLFKPNPIDIKIKSVDEWLGDNLYAQDFTVVSRANNFNKWDSMFTNPLINDFTAHNSLNFDTSYGQIRLVVSLTYAYKLHLILERLAELSNRKQQVRALMSACPAAYTVVLYATGEGDMFSRVANEQNYATLATHCHFIMASKYLKNAEDKWKIKLIESVDPRSIPSLELIDKYYPASTYFGQNTFMSYTMGLGAESCKVKGTGNNKNCPFCQLRVRMVKQTGECQISHQLKNCPALATLGNNEVDILLALMDACKGLEKKVSAALSSHKFLFGIDKKAPSSNTMLRLGDNTLLRHATPEELLEGQHINGLRINRDVYKRMCETNYAQMRLQFDKELFGPMDKLVYDLLSNIQGIHHSYQNQETPLISSLIYDSDGMPFLETKFDQKTKKPLRDFDDELFFSFTLLPLSARALKQQQFFQEELQNQQLFISLHHTFVSCLSI